MGLLFTIAAGPRQRSHSQVRIASELMTTFCSFRFETPPNLEEQGGPAAAGGGGGGGDKGTKVTDSTEQSPF
jgi:hypothetical protein